ncbi:MAG: hypothetical protein ABIU54_02740 [Candidatus Eisenbacteria bacterium]
MYLPTRAFGFVWDDLELIVGNIFLHEGRWDRLLAADYWVSTGRSSGMWRPLVMASYRLDGVLSGFTPAHFHMVNAMLHALASSLVAVLALELGAGGFVAAAVGLFFATAPAASESVAWISGRTDLLCGLFAFLAVILERRARGGGRRWRVAALLAAAAALLAKETALMLPALLLADASTDRSRSWRQRCNNLAPYFVLLVVWGVSHRAFADPMLGATDADPRQTFGAAELLFAHLVYLWPLAPHVALLDWHQPGQVVSAVAWVALAAMLVLMVVGIVRGRRWAFPLALLILPLVPVCASAFFGQQARFAERMLYLPLAGAALGLGMLASSRPRRSMLGACALVALAVAQGSVSLPVIAAWCSDETRIARIASTRPGDLDATLGLADLMGSEGRYVEARELIGRADRANPGRVEIAVALAALALRQGDPTEALAQAEAARTRDPEAAGAALLRLRALGELGRRDEALVGAREAFGQHPQDAQLEAALGHALLWADQPGEALARLSSAAHRSPQDAAIAYDQGVAAARLGRTSEAQAALVRAVTADPGLYDAWLVLAHLRAGAGDIAGAGQAISHAETLPAAADGRARALRLSMRH